MPAPGPAAARPASRRRALVPWLFLAPAILFGLVFFILPIGFAGYVSLTRWNALTAPNFIGLANYRFLVETDPRFWASVANTFVFAGASIAIGLPIALLVASALVRAKGEAVWRLLYWLPMVTNVVAVAYIWRFVLDDGYGLANRILGAVGLPAVGWLTDPGVAMLSVVLVFVWMQLGQNILLFSAGLTNIDPILYDAARLDGAPPASIFLRITVPLLRPTILFALVTNLVTGLSYFALMLVLTEGGPAGATQVTALYLYDMAFSDLRLGRAAAAAFILFAFVFVLTLVQVRLMRRGGVEAH